MSDKQQELLTALLEYHENTVDDFFVEQVSDKVLAKKRIKKRCIVLSITLALVVSFLLTLSLTGQSMEQSIKQFWLFNGVLVTVLSVGLWIVSDDFS